MNMKKRELTKRDLKLAERLTVGTSHHAKLLRERQYAAAAKDAKRYYGAPSATHSVVVKLVEWRKGEKCRPFDRAHRWESAWADMLMDEYLTRARGMRELGTMSYKQFSQLKGRRVSP